MGDSLGAPPAGDVRAPAYPTYPDRHREHGQGGLLQLLPVVSRVFRVGGLGHAGPSSRFSLLRRPLDTNKVLLSALAFLSLPFFRLAVTSVCTCMCDDRTDAITLKPGTVSNSGF